MFRSAEKGHINHTWQILMREGGFKERSRQTSVCEKSVSTTECDARRDLVEAPCLLNAEHGRVMRDESAAGLCRSGPLSHVKGFRFDFPAVVS